MRALALIVLASPAAADTDAFRTLFETAYTEGRPLYSMALDGMEPCDRLVLDVLAIDGPHVSYAYRSAAGFAGAAPEALDADVFVYADHVRRTGPGGFFRDHPLQSTVRQNGDGFILTPLARCGGTGADAPCGGADMPGFAPVEDLFLASDPCPAEASS